MDNLVFNVSERNEKGKKARMNGQIPCIIYGNELKESIPGEITKRELIRLLSCPKMYSKRNATGSFWKGNSYRFSKCKQG